MVCTFYEILPDPLPHCNPGNWEWKGHWNSGPRDEEAAGGECFFMER